MSHQPESDPPPAKRPRKVEQPVYELTCVNVEDAIRYVVHMMLQHSRAQGKERVSPRILPDITHAFEMCTLKKAILSRKERIVDVPLSGPTGDRTIRVIFENEALIDATSEFADCLQYEFRHHDALVKQAAAMAAAHVVGTLHEAMNVLTQWRVELGATTFGETGGRRLMYWGQFTGKHRGQIGQLMDAINQGDLGVEFMAAREIKKCMRFQGVGVMQTLLDTMGDDSKAVGRVRATQSKNKLTATAPLEAMADSPEAQDLQSDGRLPEHPIMVNSVDHIYDILSNVKIKTEAKAHIVDSRTVLDWGLLHHKDVKRHAQLGQLTAALNQSRTKVCFRIGNNRTPVNCVFPSAEMMTELLERMKASTARAVQLGKKQPTPKAPQSVVEAAPADAPIPAPNSDGLVDAEYYDQGIWAILNFRKTFVGQSVERTTRSKSQGLPTLTHVSSLKSVLQAFGNAKDLVVEITAPNRPGIKQQNLKVKFRDAAHFEQARQLLIKLNGEFRNPKIDKPTVEAAPPEAMHAPALAWMEPPPPVSADAHVEFQAILTFMHNANPKLLSYECPDVTGRFIDLKQAIGGFESESNNITFKYARQDYRRAFATEAVRRETRELVRHHNLIYKHIYTTYGAKKKANERKSKLRGEDRAQQRELKKQKRELRQTNVISAAIGLDSLAMWFLDNETERVVDPVNGVGLYDVKPVIDMLSGPTTLLTGRLLFDIELTFADDKVLSDMVSLLTEQAIRRDQLRQCTKCQEVKELAQFYEGRHDCIDCKCQVGIDTRAEEKVIKDAVFEAKRVVYLEAEAAARGIATWHVSLGHQRLPRPTDRDWLPEFDNVTNMSHIADQLARASGRAVNLVSTSTLDGVESKLPVAFGSEDARDMCAGIVRDLGLEYYRITMATPECRAAALKNERERRASRTPEQHTRELAVARKAEQLRHQRLADRGLRKCEICRDVKQLDAFFFTPAEAGVYDHLFVDKKTYKRSCRDCYPTARKLVRTPEKLLRDYNQSDKWDMTKNEALALITADCCHYCETPNTFLAGQQDDDSDPTIGWRLMGIDRIVPEESYTVANTCACCPRCNHSKQLMDYADFIGHAHVVTRFQTEAIPASILTPYYQNYRQRATQTPMFGGISYLDAKASAAARGRTFINEDLHAAIVAQPCAYCGLNPSVRPMGVDRVDNNIGYEPENICSACSTCNMIKGQQTRENFLVMLARIALAHPKV